jgi:hypothetical protein
MRNVRGVVDAVCSCISPWEAAVQRPHSCLAKPRPPHVQHRRAGLVLMVSHGPICRWRWSCGPRCGCMPTWTRCCAPCCASRWQAPTRYAHGTYIGGVALRFSHQAMNACVHPSIHPSILGGGAAVHGGRLCGSARRGPWVGAVCAGHGSACHLGCGCWPRPDVNARRLHVQASAGPCGGAPRERSTVAVAPHRIVRRRMSRRVPCAGACMRNDYVTAPPCRASTAASRGPSPTCSCAAQRPPPPSRCNHHAPPCLSLSFSFRSRPLY